MQHLQFFQNWVKFIFLKLNYVKHISNYTDFFKESAVHYFISNFTGDFVKDSNLLFQD